MEIDQLDGAGLPKRPDRLGGADDSGPKPERATAEGGDRIQLSHAARLRASLAEAASRLDDIRQDKIANLRHELDQGTYLVDARRVAEAIVEFEDGLDR